MDIHIREAPRPAGRRAGEGAVPLDRIAVRLQKSEVTLWNDCRKTWRFRSDTIAVRKDRQIVTFDGKTHGEMLGKEGKAATVSAGGVSVNILSGNVSIPDLLAFDVVNGPSVKAKKIYWNPEKSRLFCEGGVTAQLPMGSIKGSKVILDLDRKEITAFGITGVIAMDELP